MSAKSSQPKPNQRQAFLKSRQNLKMARSALAYVRGSTVKFYEWLETAPGNVPQGPSVWICGDCHAGNLGPLASAEGKVEIEIRDLDQITREEATAAAKFLAGVVGRAHARQMDRSAKKEWRSALLRDRSKSLDAPSWLWTSVVELIASHETAYLEHCRRYALSPTAS